MELLYSRKETKYIVETVNLPDQELVQMVEIFVKNKLIDEAQEVFYEYLKGKEITLELAKDALFQAVVSDQSVKIIHDMLKDFNDDPKKLLENAKKFLKAKSQDSLKQDK